MTPHLIIPIPGLKIVSEANARGNWKAGWSRSRKQKQFIAFYLAQHRPVLRTPAVVRMVRIGKRKMDDDNLARAFKAVRDQIAKSFGVDDGDGSIEWDPKQERGAYGVRLEIWCGVRRQVTTELVEVEEKAPDIQGVKS